MTNKEFLFLYDAALCNPNGDPDQENKPRMDRATRTNLVTDLRIKRNIRDYIIANEKNGDIDVFVRKMGEDKVSVSTRLHSEVKILIDNPDAFNALLVKNPDLKLVLIQAANASKKNTKDAKASEKNEQNIDCYAFFKGILKVVTKKSTANNDNEDVEEKGFKITNNPAINNALLLALIKTKFIDVRFFGGAFAVSGFSNSITGSIQINMGYSLHPVELNGTTIVTLMGDKDGGSGIGKKESLFYSLLGFTGTVNHKKADIVALTDNDLTKFRNALIKSILEERTDSKKNQYPHLYLELDYKEGETYGRLGDLRHLVSVKSVAKDRKDDTDFTKVRQLNDMELDFSQLITQLQGIKERLNTIRLWVSLNSQFANLEQALQNANLPVEILSI
jgi:CRISPR-associated protein Csh2